MLVLKQNCQMLSQPNVENFKMPLKLCPVKDVSLANTPIFPTTPTVISLDVFPKGCS